MADRKLVRVLNRILTAANNDCGVSDADLLDRFTRQGDAAAFELLVWRYQRLVLGIFPMRQSHGRKVSFISG